METQQLEAALSGVSRDHLGPHQHPVPAGATGRRQSAAGQTGALLRPSHLQQKSWKVLRTGKPRLRIFTVSNIPEYLSWFRTKVGSNWSGI